MFLLLICYKNDLFCTKITQKTIKQMAKLYKYVILTNPRSACMITKVFGRLILNLRFKKRSYYNIRKARPDRGTPKHIVID